MFQEFGWFAFESLRTSLCIYICVYAEDVFDCVVVILVRHVDFIRIKLLSLLTFSSDSMHAIG